MAAAFLAFVCVDVTRALAGADLDAEGILAPWWEYALAIAAGFAARAIYLRADR